MCVCVHETAQKVHLVPKPSRPFSPLVFANRLSPYLVLRTLLPNMTNSGPMADLRPLRCYSEQAVQREVEPLRQYGLHQHLRLVYANVLAVQVRIVSVLGGKRTGVWLLAGKVTGERWQQSSCVRFPRNAREEASDPKNRGFVEK